MTTVPLNHHEGLWRSFALQLQHTPEYLGFYLKGYDAEQVSRRHGMTTTDWWKLCLCRKPRDEHEIVLIEVELCLRPGTLQAILTPQSEVLPTDHYSLAAAQ